MTVYVVLFRGVGGATQLPTARLRSVLTEAGFGSVSSYINSGNAVLKTDLSRDQAHARIALLARQHFAFDKEIMLRSATEWATALAENPYPEAEAIPTSLHLFTLSAAPRVENVAALEARLQPGERLSVRRDVVYFHAPAGFGTSKTPPLIDRLLGVSSTARNWNTVVKLRDLATAAA